LKYLSEQMLQEFFSSINLLAISCSLITAWRRSISDRHKGTRARGKRGRGSSTYGVYQNVVGSTRGTLYPPSDSPASPTMRRSMAPNSQQWPQQPYINGPWPVYTRQRALYRPREFCVSIRIANPIVYNPIVTFHGFQHARKLSYCMFVCCVCMCVSQRKRSIPDARISLQMRLNFVNDKSCP